MPERLSDERLDAYRRCVEVGECHEDCPLLGNEADCIHEPTTRELVGRFLSHIDALTAENERLREALKLCRMWVGTGNATADYEAFAEAFYRDTHMLAPGKSEPLNMGGLHSREELQTAWDAWVEEKRAVVLAALMEATP